MTRWIRWLSPRDMDGRPNPRTVLRKWHKAPAGAERTACGKPLPATAITLEERQGPPERPTHRCADCWQAHRAALRKDGNTA